jgi:hypothetical protein
MDNSGTEIATKLKLIRTKKYPESDNIAGKNYHKYEDVIYHFLTNIVALHPYLMISYPLVFTGNHNLSWMKQIDISKNIELIYKPSAPKFFYLYNEIYQLFLAGKKFNRILCIELNNGFIELLKYHGKLSKNTHITFIGTDKSGAAFNDFITEHKDNLNMDNIIVNTTLGKKIYDILDVVLGGEHKQEKKRQKKLYDLIVFNYHTFSVGIDFNFAFLQITINYVAMMLALQSLAKGGTLVLDMYAITNKSNADTFIILKNHFADAKLYFPECANEYSATGTWAIFTGFEGILPAELAELQSILAGIKELYPNGINDVNIYDPEIRKKCWVSKAIDNNLQHEYIAGYLPNSPDDKIYDYIRDFNTATYDRKYKFSKKVYDLWQNHKYPETNLLPTFEQNQASINYLNKWKFDYVLRGNVGQEPKLMDLFGSWSEDNSDKHTYLIKTDYLDLAMVADEFKKRGNWVPFDPVRHEKLDFFYIDGLHIADRSLFSIKSELKNLIGDTKKMVTVKSNLYTNLSKIPGSNRFLPWTREFDIKGQDISFLNQFRKYFDKGRPYICKIVNMGEGQNIITTDKFSEFRAFMSRYFKMLKTNPKMIINKWVLQEYITRPYLINDRKFHIRLILVFQPGNKPSYYMHHSRIALAEQPYVHGDWTNKDIHDTHFHRRAGLSWPYDFQLSEKDMKDIYDQYDFILSCIVSSIPPSCYPDSKHCYEIFGVDLMLTDDLTVKLIEVNDRIGISADSYFKTKLFRGIMSLVVDKYFPPKNEQLLPGNFFVIHHLNTKKTTPRKTNTSKKNTKRKPGVRLLSKTKKHSAKHFLKFD